MANHASALKRNRQTVVKTTTNRFWKSRVRAVTKDVLTAVENKKAKEAQEALLAATREIDKASGKGVIHKNAASRKISRMSKAVAAIS